MGAREVWQMFPSVIPSHDFTSFFFFNIPEGQRNVPFHFSSSLFFLSLYLNVMAVDVTSGTDPCRID